MQLVDFCHRVMSQQGSELCYASRIELLKRRYMLLQITVLPPAAEDKAV